MHILTNISGNKGNQTMKLGQLIDYKRIEIFFLKNNAENEAGILVPGLFLFFKYAQYGLKASGLQLNFNIFRKLST